MVPKSSEKWIILQPPLSIPDRSIPIFIRLASAIARIQRRTADDDRDREMSSALEKSLSKAHSDVAKDFAMLNASTRVLCDLARQRWCIRVRNRKVEVCPPAELRTDPKAEKERVRRQELIKRNEQLEQPSVRRFIQDMERQRLYRGRFVSIFSLMRDGRELAAALRATQQLTGEQRTNALRLVIDPYLQFVTEDARCDFTGFRLQDVWRYFRHTWSNQYTSTPGRTMAFLVRDRAAPLHPVVGIASIGSPIMQIKERDAWIGWHPTAFFRHALENPSPKLGEWLRRVVKNAIAEIFIGDFVEEALVSIAEIRHPSPDMLARLRSYGDEQRRLHHRFVRAQEHKANGSARSEGNNDLHWMAKAQTHLFRSKRALTLAELLRARLTIDRYLGSVPTSTEVAALFADREGKAAVARILRKAKADRVGIAMADISVCGAVQPYNAILGGKLIAMLAASPEVIQAYRQRYGTAESEIASSMAARAIVRPADLVFLGTTSLYGVGSSQYNRVRIPVDRLGGRAGEDICYIELGRSESFGTSQFSSATVDALVGLVHQVSGGQRVNSIFGEGISPKLRKIREGLDVLRFPTDNLLRHGRRRIVYGVAVARNTREMLLGMENNPDYIFSLWGADATNAIANWWRERWLSRRIEQDRVLADVAAHTLVRPIRHGARVKLPTEFIDSQVSAEEELS